MPIPRPSVAVSRLSAFVASTRADPATAEWFAYRLLANRTIDRHELSRAADAVLARDIFNSWAAQTPNASLAPRQLRSLDNIFSELNPSYSLAQHITDKLLSAGKPEPVLSMLRPQANQNLLIQAFSSASEERHAESPHIKEVMRRCAYHLAAHTWTCFHRLDRVDKELHPVGMSYLQHINSWKENDLADSLSCLNSALEIFDQELFDNPEFLENMSNIRKHLHRVCNTPNTPQASFIKSARELHTPLSAHVLRKQLGQHAQPKQASPAPSRPAM